MANDQSKQLLFDASPEQIQLLYEKFKGEFSLEDLKAFQVSEDETVPFAEVVKELEELVQRTKA